MLTPPTSLPHPISELCQCVAFLSLGEGARGLSGKRKRRLRCAGPVSRRRGRSALPPHSGFVGQRPRDSAGPDPAGTQDGPGRFVRVEQGPARRDVCGRLRKWPCRHRAGLGMGAAWGGSACGCRPRRALSASPSTRSGLQGTVHRVPSPLSAQGLGWAPAPSLGGMSFCRMRGQTSKETHAGLTPKEKASCPCGLFLVFCLIAFQ